MAADASPDKQQAGEAGEIKPRGAEYGGYKLTSELFASLVSLLVGLAWPALVLLLLCLLYQNRVAVMKYVDKFTSVEISVPPGIKFSWVAASVTSGLITQQTIATSEPVTPSQRETLEQLADAAVEKLKPKALQPGPLLKVLWVDDHPQNNIGLQYAFQALGMIVICIDSDAGIAPAFTTANGFDVVITDMGRGPNLLAGEETTKIIRNQFGTPVIVYADRRYVQSQTGELVKPVIAITDDPQKVFTEVTGIAATLRASKR